MERGERRREGIWSTVWKEGSGGERELEVRNGKRGAEDRGGLECGMERERSEMEGPSER